MGLFALSPARTGPDRKSGKRGEDLPRTVFEALTQRGNVAVASVELDPFHPMHREKYRSRRRVLTGIDQAREVVEGIQVDSAHGDARKRCQERPPRTSRAAY